MVEKLNIKYKGLSVYIDELSQDNKCLRGRKGNKTEFIIVSRNVANILMNSNRIKSIEDLLKD